VPAVVCCLLQVPFIGWTGDLPLLGQQLYRFLSNISGSTASIIFQRTGQQFFLMDGATAAAAAAAAAPPTTAAEQARGRGAELDGSIADSSTSHLPLLLQMTQDCPDRGLFFYSALAAFKTRTCYANMGETTDLPAHSQCSTASFVKDLTPMILCSLDTRNGTLAGCTGCGTQPMHAC